MIRVLIAEDMHMVRGGLVELFEGEADLAVVAQTGMGSEVVPSALRTRPDIALVDIGMPGLDGISAAAQLRMYLPRCKVLILTASSEFGDLRRAMDAHVAGFLLKTTPAQELMHSIRGVAAGAKVIDPALVLDSRRDQPNPLTDRETSVLRIAAEGKDMLRIAIQLNLTVGTVRNYVRSAITKLNARNRLDAIRIARDSGWIF